jgi:hypothetical protein
VSACRHPRCRMAAGGAIECMDCPAKWASFRDIPPITPTVERFELTDKGRAALREPLPGPVDPPRPPGWDKGVA